MDNVPDARRSALRVMSASQAQCRTGCANDIQSVDPDGPLSRADRQRTSSCAGRRAPSRPKPDRSMYFAAIAAAMGGGGDALVSGAGSVCSCSRRWSALQRFNRKRAMSAPWLRCNSSGRAPRCAPCRAGRMPSSDRRDNSGCLQRRVSMSLSQRSAPARASCRKPYARFRVMAKMRLFMHPRADDTPLAFRQGLSTNWRHKRLL